MNLRHSMYAIYAYIGVVPGGSMGQQSYGSPTTIWEFFGPVFVFRCRLWALVRSGHCFPYQDLAGTAGPDAFSSTKTPSDGTHTTDSWGPPSVAFRDGRGVNLEGLGRQWQAVTGRVDMSSTDMVWALAQTRPRSWRRGRSSIY